MDRQHPHLHSTVEELLNSWPFAAGAFNSLRTSCVGCYLARFCTLEDVAITYGLSKDEVMDEVLQVVQITPLINSGGIHA